MLVCRPTGLVIVQVSVLALNTFVHAAPLMLVVSVWVAKLPPERVTARVTFCTSVRPAGVLVVVETTGENSPKRGSGCSVVVVCVPSGTEVTVLPSGVNCSELFNPSSSVLRRDRAPTLGNVVWRVACRPSALVLLTLHAPLGWSVSVKVVEPPAAAGSWSCVSRPNESYVY